MLDRARCSCKKRGCRLGRPLCARQRRKTKKYRPCTCQAYHYPHRHGSGRCEHHPEGTRRQWEHFTGEKWEEESTAAE